MNDPTSNSETSEQNGEPKMMMILGILLAATVAVALMLGQLAKMSFRERVLSTAAMLAAAFVFYGLVVLVEGATH